jgi:hypothetical protein
MKTIQKLSLRSLSVYALLLFALLAGTGPLAFGQESVQGTLTLPVAAKLGNTSLPPGEYKFYVHLLGPTRSMEGVQLVSSRVAVLLMGTTKDAPLASALALVSRPGPNAPKMIDLLPEGNSLSIHAICLDSLGLVVEFYESNSKGTVSARVTQPSSAVISANATN